MSGLVYGLLVPLALGHWYRARN